MSQFRRRFLGIAAEELHVLHAVGLGVLPCVVNGLRHDLRADGLLAVLGHAQGDGARPAIEVKHRLLPRQGGELHRLAVQHLRLCPVHLIEGRHAEPERQSPQGVPQGVLPPQGSVAVAQDHIASFAVDAPDDTHRAGDSLSQQLHQLRFTGRTFSVAQQADQALPRPVGTDIQMPQQAPARFLVIAGHPELPDVLPHRLSRRVSLRHLQAALLYTDDLVAAGAVKAHRTVGRDGILALVAVAVRVRRAQDLLHLYIAAAETGQGVLHPLAFGGQFLGIVHVAEVAACRSRGSPAPAGARTAYGWPSPCRRRRASAPS